MKRQGKETSLSFLFTSFFSEPMTFQWLIAARKIGKRLATLEPPLLSQRSDENHELIYGVAGCAVKRKKLKRLTE